MAMPRPDTQEDLQVVHDKLGHVWSLLSVAHGHCEDLTTVGEAADLHSLLTKMELSDRAEKLIEQLEAITLSDGEIAKMIETLRLYGAKPDEIASKVRILYGKEAESPFDMVLRGFKMLQPQEKRIVYKYLLSPSDQPGTSKPGARELVINSFDQLNEHERWQVLQLLVDLL